MSMIKAIEHGKEHRKPYHGAAAVDPSCRPHGRCGYCYNNRMHSTRQRLAKSDITEGVEPKHE